MFEEQLPTRTCARAVSDRPISASSPLAWRSARQSVGGFALMVDAKGEEAKSFYLRYGRLDHCRTPWDGQAHTKECALHDGAVLV